MANSFLIMLKNLNFKKQILAQSPLAQLKIIFSLTYEGSQCKEPADPELYTLALKSVLSLMCLPQVFTTNPSRKFYIPGETMELDKLRQRAIEYGLLTYLAFIDGRNKNEDFKSILQRELWSLVDETDFSQHFARTGSGSMEQMLRGLDERADLDHAETLIKQKQTNYMEQRSQI